MNKSQNHNKTNDSDSPSYHENRAHQILRSQLTQNQEKVLIDTKKQEQIETVDLNGEEERHQFVSENQMNQIRMLNNNDI